METKVEMKEPIEAVSANNASEVKVKKFPSLRGGGCCCQTCGMIVIIIITLIIGSIIMAVGGAAYGNDDKNTDARNATIAGGVILLFGFVCCLGAICQACQDSCDFCCDCHLEFK